MMNREIDLSKAVLLAAPEALRDGGSVCLALRIGGSDYSLRYAGGFADVLNNRDGMVEMSVFGEESSGLFIEPESIVGLAAFIVRHETEFGRFGDVFLGRRKRTEAQIEEVRAWFVKKPDV